MLNVRKPVLLLTAGALWLIAGVNILRIGVAAFASCPSFLLPAALALLIFIGFSMMFMRIVQKHQRRILGYPEARKSIFFCFDRKGYLLMVFMIALGITLRASGLLPPFFFAFFYTGLGSALAFAALQFIGAGLKHWAD